MMGGIDDLSGNHPLNTTSHKSKTINPDVITCYEFWNEMMIAGYGDGLVVSWDIGPVTLEDIKPEFMPLLGHTNKVNQIKACPINEKIFTCSDDCTLRMWSME